MSSEFRIFTWITILHQMRKKDNLYLAPRTDWSALGSRDLLCDSYGSGIDDFEYEDLDWTVKP